MALFKKAAPVVPASVAEITSKLSNTVVELESHAERQAAQANFQREMAERSLIAADEATAEAELAVKVAGNIKSLLGA